VVGKENRVFLWNIQGQVEGTSCWSLRCRGTLCVLFGLLCWCGYEEWLYPYGWLMTSTLRYGEGELAFSNIKISLEGKNGTGLGGVFVTQMGDLWAGLVQTTIISVFSAFSAFSASSVIYKQ
jgi:hypothetical protein